MAENSKIGWTHHTWNPWMGCTRVSEECRYCYISGILKRQGWKDPFGGPQRTKYWRKPFKWDRKAESQGTRYRIFTCSMSDFFHDDADAWRDDAWEVIKQCSVLDWLILTKRPELIRDRLPSDWGNGYANVWLGTTCGVKSSLGRVETLQAVPAAVRFISAEPLLEGIDFHLEGTHWIITGCESAGKDKRRPMDLDWVRAIDGQCREAGIPHFFKQRYEGNQLVYDGVLDGKVRQELPK